MRFRRQQAQHRGTGHGTGTGGDAGWHVELSSPLTPFVLHADAVKRAVDKPRLRPAIDNSYHQDETTG